MIYNIEKYKKYNCISQKTSLNLTFLNQNTRKFIMISNYNIKI